MQRSPAVQRWLALCDQLWAVQDALDTQRRAHHALPHDQCRCACCDSVSRVMAAIDTSLTDASGRAAEEV
jgi:hypothetical protein